ncbi:MAG: rhodanese-like domain-containing protein [Opitutaceae bacterium]|jgi:rhodanese-related sulfurtransferase
MSTNPRFKKLVAETKGHIREIKVDELTSLEASAVTKPILIDVREVEEFSAGHAADALHLSRGTLEGKIEAAVPDVNTPVVLYCASGNRSAFAAESLQKMGYTNVASLIGGFGAWLKAGRPVEK